MNRAARRRARSLSKIHGAVMAEACFDFQATGAMAVTDRQAVAALARAFALLVRSGGKPVAVPISPAEARGFPNHAVDDLPGGVTWLAVGFDAGRRGTYAVHTAWDTDRALAHDAARALALARLADLCTTTDFPVAPRREPYRRGHP